MEFAQPLVPATLVTRYKRFFADVVMADGTPVTAHCPNPGAMLGLNTPGLPCWLSRSDDPKRKLAHTLELVEADGGIVGINTVRAAFPKRSSLVGVNTHRANTIVAEALSNSAIPELAGYDTIRREVAYGAASRVDFLLEARGRPRCWVEVKSVTLHRGGGLAEFPDCTSARGLRHVLELQAMVEAGDRAIVLFIVQRADCDRFTVATDLDRKLGDALAEAEDAGVEVLPYGCSLSPDGIALGSKLSRN